MMDKFKWKNASQIKNLKSFDNNASATSNKLENKIIDLNDRLKVDNTSSSSSSLIGWQCAIIPLLIAFIVFIVIIIINFKNNRLIGDSGKSLEVSGTFMMIPNVNLTDRYIIHRKELIDRANEACEKGRYNKEIIILKEMVEFSNWNINEREMRQIRIAYRRLLLIGSGGRKNRLKYSLDGLKLADQIRIVADENWIYEYSTLIGDCYLILFDSKPKQINHIWLQLKRTYRRLLQIADNRIWPNQPNHPNRLDIVTYFARLCNRYIPPINDRDTIEYLRKLVQDAKHFNRDRLSDKHYGWSREWIAWCERELIEIDTKLNNNSHDRVFVDI